MGERVGVAQNHLSAGKRVGSVARGTGAERVGSYGVLALQRQVGNAAVSALIGTWMAKSTQGVVQRDKGTKSVDVTGVRLSARKASVPPEPGLSLTATAQPANATGVKFSIEKGTVAPTNISIDAASGAITLSAGQAGGQVNVKAEDAQGNSADQPLLVVEKPNTITATSPSSLGNDKLYGGEFIHTFDTASGHASALEGANINEKFDSLKATTPFGDFTLQANKAGSPGWTLDASGTMLGPDKVGIDRAMVNMGDFVLSASNSKPHALPAGFTMVQHLHSKSFPSGKLDTKAFLDVDHKRTLTDKAKFVVEAGKDKWEDDYDGLPAFSNAKARPSTIAASAPPPKAPKGSKTKPAWTNRNTAQVTADVVPSGSTMVFSIKGPKLNCEIDKDSGEVLIGDQPGTITVHVTGEKGKTKNFDEVTITITPAPQPANPASP